MKHILLLTIIMLTACGNENSISILPTDNEEQVVDEILVPSPIVPPVPVICGEGIGAVDMALKCRATPNPTMGALEA